MTDEVYQVKNWLMRADELDQQWKRTRNKVLLIQDRLNGGVTNYYSSGKKDLITAQSNHEDLLMEYSMLREQLDREIEQCLHEDNITLQVIDCMGSPFHRSILIARYVCRMDWNTILKDPLVEVKKTQLLEHHKLALEELALILKADKLEIVKDTSLRATANK